MRRPYRTTPGSYKGVFFYEKLGKNGLQHYLWGNAAFAFASVIIREFGNIGWFAQTRGVPRDQLAGGVVTGYEPVPIPGSTGASHILTDVIITDTGSYSDIVFALITLLVNGAARAIIARRKEYSGANA